MSALLAQESTASSTDPQDVSLEGFSLDGYESRGGIYPARGIKVKVYRNLNRPSMYSIMAAEGPHRGRVLGYARCVRLTDIEFRVGLKSRERVLAKQVRNVHAFAVGRLSGTNNEVSEAAAQLPQVTYSPYLHDHFFRRDTSEPVVSARFGCLAGTGCYAML